MAQVHVDSEKLRAFARQLKGFGEGVDNDLTNLKSEVGRLGATWRDQEYESFSRQFSSAQQLLQKFVEEIRRVTPLLERDAAAIDEYSRLKP